MNQRTFILDLARRAAWLVSKLENRDFLRERVEEFFRRVNGGIPRPYRLEDGPLPPQPNTLQALFPPYSPWGIGYDDLFLRDCVLMAIIHDGAWREDYGFDSERSVYFFEPVYLDEPADNTPVTADDQWAVMVYSELLEIPWLSTPEQVEAARDLIRRSFQRVEEAMPSEPEENEEAGFEPSSVFRDSLPRTVRKGWDPDMDAYRQRTAPRSRTGGDKVAQFEGDCSACMVYFAKEDVQKYWLEQIGWHEMWSWGHERTRPLNPDDIKDLRIIYTVMGFCMEKSTGTHIIPRHVIWGERRRFYLDPPISTWICERGYSTWMRAYIEADLQKQGLLTAADIIPRANGSPDPHRSKVPEPEVQPGGGVIPSRAETTGTGEGQSAKNCGWELDWNDRLPGYMMSGEARRKYTGGRLIASSLSKKLGAIPVHFMRYGQRCKVHEGEFHAWAKKEYPGEYLTIEERAEIADEVQSEREKQKRIEREGRGK